MIRQSVLRHPSLSTVFRLTSLGVQVYSAMQTIGTRILNLGVIPEGKSSEQSVLVTRLTVAKLGE